MIKSIAILTLILLCPFLHGQNIHVKKKQKADIHISVPIVVQWMAQIPGNFSFRKHWSYLEGVVVKEDGRAGCGDGGLCPERCYDMMDSNGIVLKDSAKIFYELLDTSHQYYSIECEAWCYEWAGTDFIDVVRKGKDSVSCNTWCNIATHCSLKMEIIKDTCYAIIDLNSITPNGQSYFYCTGGTIRIDQKLWHKGIMKAEFNMTFKNTFDDKKPMFWKGKLYAKIEVP